MDGMNAKLRQVCEAFRIQGTYQPYEEIKMGNVNQTYKVNYLRSDGEAKSYIVQAVNTYAPLCLLWSAIEVT